MGIYGEIRVNFRKKLGVLRMNWRAIETREEQPGAEASSNCAVIQICKVTQVSALVRNFVFVARFCILSFGTDSALESARHDHKPSREHLTWNRQLVS